MEFYTALQAWLQYVTQPWWVRGLGMIAGFWILMQLLPNDWAGGHLFDRAYAWITTALATVIVFVIFVLPWVTWQLLVAIVVCALLAGLTWYARTNWH